MNYQGSHEIIEIEAAPPPRSVNPLLAWLHAKRWFLIVVGLPTLLATVYYGFIAANEFVSESRFIVKKPDEKGPQLNGLASLVQTSGLSNGQEETNEIINYVRSRDALDGLQKRMNVKAAFEDPSADFLSRYPGPFNQDRFENLFKFYSKKVSVNLDMQDGIATLTVRAFSPDAAYSINENVLELSEQLVNRLNTRAQEKAIEEASRRVSEAEKRVIAARIAMRTFRNTEQIIDPESQAKGTINVSNELVAQRAALAAQFEKIRSAAPRNPALPALADQISALDRQIALQNGKAYGSSTAIATKMVGYEGKLVEQDLATAMLKSASASLEEARIEAQKQQFYLERVVNPNKPDMPLLPKRFYRILVIFASAVCLYFIGWMLIVGILEHSPER